MVEVGTIVVMIKLIDSMLGGAILFQKSAPSKATSLKKHRAKWKPFQRQKALNRVEEIFAEVTEEEIILVDPDVFWPPGEMEPMTEKDEKKIWWWRDLMGDYALMAYGEATPEEVNYLFNRLDPIVQKYIAGYRRLASVPLEERVEAGLPFRIQQEAVSNLGRLWPEASITSSKIIAIDSLMSILHDVGLDVIKWDDWDGFAGQFWVAVATERILNKLYHGTLLNE